MLHSRSLEQNYLVSGNLYPLTNIFPFPQLFPCPDNHHSVLCFYEIQLFYESAYKREHTVFVFLCLNLSKGSYGFYSHYFNVVYHAYWASLVAQTVKNLPAVWETWVRTLGWEDPLEKGMATNSNILAWRTPKDRGAWWATVHGVAKRQT